MSNNKNGDAVEDPLNDNVNEQDIPNFNCLEFPVAVTVLLNKSMPVMSCSVDDPNSNKINHKCDGVEFSIINSPFTLYDHHHNLAKLNVTECVQSKTSVQDTQNSAACLPLTNETPKLNGWGLSEVPNSQCSSNGDHQGDTSDYDGDSLGVEESWSMDSEPGSHCSSLMDIINHENNDITATPGHLNNYGLHLNNNTNGYLNDAMSLSSQLSDSLSSLSLQDGSPLTTTSSAYCSGSAVSQNAILSCNTFEKLEVSNSKTVLGPMRASMFPYFPPTINFMLPEQIPEKDFVLSEDIKKIMKWQLTKTTPVILKKILLASGFRFTRKLNDWIGSWAKHMKAFEFQYLRDFQKINHFPGTFQVGRKDRLWKNICRMQHLHSKQEFGFVPTTFVLPADLRRLWLAWNNYGNKPRWIVKPPAAARGKGIHIVHKFGQLPKQGSFIVQRYISQPYLINGSKFDLRIYVYIPSFNPLRIYLCSDGLVRFASVKYSNAVHSLKNQFMHLTNSSVNKVHESYVICGDGDSYDGHKWSLKALWNYLSHRGINTSEIWDNISDIIIKTIISSEPCVNVLTRGNVKNTYNCHEVFGFDIMLDANLKPWLLEVNISPSLHSSSKLDIAVKGKMLRELFNLAGFKLPSHLSTAAREELATSLKIDPSFVTLDVKLLDTELSAEERNKQTQYAVHEREDYIDSILKDLSPKDVFHLSESEDELSRAQHFQRIFPSHLTHKYHKFFCNPQYYSNLLDAWETKYHSDREEGCRVLQNLCKQKVHLENLSSSIKQDMIQPTEFKKKKSAHVCCLRRTSVYNLRLRWLQRTRSSVISAIHKSRCRKIRRKKMVVLATNF